MEKYLIDLYAFGDDLPRLYGLIEQGLRRTELSDKVRLLPHQLAIVSSQAGLEEIDPRSYVEVKRGEREIFQTEKRLVKKTTPAFYFSYVNSVIGAIRKDAQRNWL